MADILWKILGVEPITANTRSTHPISLNKAGDVIAIGSPSNDDDSELERVRVFKLDADVWTQVGEDGVGHYVSLDDTGTRVAIGSISGVAVYEFTSAAWSQVGLEINVGGNSVSLSGDGKVLASNNGVYTLEGDEWVETMTFDSASSVSLSRDGKRVAIGSANEGNGDGRIRVYKVSSGDQLGEDIIGTAGLTSRCGTSIDLNANGKTIVIGCPNAGDPTTGSARVYTYSSGSWTQRGDDIIGKEELDSNGESVAINDDGTIVAVGAPSNSNSYGFTHVVQWIEDEWKQLGTATIDGTMNHTAQGMSVALNGQGGRVATATENSVGIYNFPYFGCTDSSANNHSETSIISDDSCTYDNDENPDEKKEEEEDKKWYKMWWVWLIVVIVIVLLGLTGYFMLKKR